MGPSPSHPPGRPRRFYAAAGVAEQPQGVAVTLDRWVAKTPAGRSLVLPTEALASLIAAEWSAQDETIDYAAMPATRLAFTVIDRTRGAGAVLAAEVARYAVSDALCYFAEAPDALVERQAIRWGAMLDWARSELGVDLIRVAGLMPRPQSPEAVARVAALVEALEPFAQAGVAYAAPLFGSAVLALALQRGQLDADAAFDLSRLEEAFQEERWGVDVEAAERTERLRYEARALGHWFDVLAGS
jgi:chaperone required for assembly of F1-ATPase